MTKTVVELGFTKNNKSDSRLNSIDLENFYQHYIPKKYNLKEREVLLFENTFLLGNLMMRLNNGTPIGRSANGLIKKMKVNNFIFIPACRENDHWTLFVYDKENKTFHHYNSYKGIDNLKYFSSLLKGDILGTDKNNIKEHNAPQQGDGVSCGLYVVAITELLVRKYQKNPTGMTWEINNKEAEEIKKNVSVFRKMLVDGKDYFADLTTETTQKNDAELEKIRQKITNVYSIFTKNETNKEELGQAVKDLKNLADAEVGSPEKTIWEEKREENEKLLVGLKEKLNKKTIDNSLNSDENISQTEPKSTENENVVNPNSGNDDEINVENEVGTSQTNQQLEEIRGSLNNDINQAENGTDDDKVNAIKNSGKIVGEEGFESEKAKVATFEEQLIKNNPLKYLEAVIGKVEENMKKNNLSIEELNDETRTIYQRIKNNIENMNENIGKQGAKKRFTKLKEEITKFLKLSRNKTSEKLGRLKDKLLEIIHSKNKYDQEYKQETQKLLTQLESRTQTNSPDKKSIPWNHIAPFSLLGIGLIVGAIAIRKRRKAKIKKK